MGLGDVSDRASVGQANSMYGRDFAAGKSQGSSCTLPNGRPSIRCVYFCLFLIDVKMFNSLCVTCLLCQIFPCCASVRANFFYSCFCDVHYCNFILHSLMCNDFFSLKK